MLLCMFLYIEEPATFKRSHICQNSSAFVTFNRQYRLQIKKIRASSPEKLLNKHKKIWWKDLRIWTISSLLCDLDFVYGHGNYWIMWEDSISSSYNPMHLLIIVITCIKRRSTSKENALKAGESIRSAENKTKTGNDAKPLL